MPTISSIRAPAAALRAFFAARPRGRRVAIAAVILAFFAAVAGVVAPWTFSTKALVDEITRQMRTNSGLYVAAKGRTVFALWPRPHIAIDRIAFADPNAALFIEADSLHGNVGLAPLFAGRLEIAQLVLERPRIVVDLDRKPMAAAGAAVRASATKPATPEAEKADNARLGVVVFVNGAARVKRGGEEHQIADIDATLDWRRVGAPATFSGSFSWRGERPRATLWIARPGALLRGDQSPLTLRLDGDSLKFEAEGYGQTGPQPRYSGHVAFSAASLRQVLHLLDVSAPLPGPFENIQLSAQASLGWRDAQLTDLRLLADDNEFAGSLAVRQEDGRPVVQASLTSQFVSLKPMLAEAPPVLGSDGQWSREPFETPDLTGADADVRLTAAHARLGRLSLDDTALSLTLRAGRLDLALSEARAYRGTVMAQATFAAVPEGLEFHATAQTFGVDAGALLWDAAARQNLSGQLTSAITLDAKGDSVAALTRDLDGRASLTLTQGEIVGVDLERALRRMDKRPLSSLIDIRSGRSALDKATATIKIVNGVANIEEGVAHGPGFSITFGGAARVVERVLSLKGQAAEADGAGKPREKGQQIAFDVSGNWDELSVIPDAQALIKRSGAAAPLLPRGEGEAETETEK